MIRKPRLLHKAFALALAALWTLPLAARGGQVAARPQYAPGQVLLYCQPGTPQADVNALAAEVNAVAVTPISIPDYYKLDLPAANQNNADTLAAITKLKLDPRVRNAQVNYYFYPHQTSAPPSTKPDDALYAKGLQWDMDLINMPEAWVLQKGATGTNVAVIDSGGDPTHPDLQGQYLPDGANFLVTPPNNSWQAVGTGQEAQHGVHVSGTIDAITNNGIGIAGIAGWGQHVKILMLRVFDQNGGGATDASVAAAIQWCADHQATDNIKVVNMSLGAGPGADPTNTNDPEYIALQNCITKGILLVASAGNDSLNDNTTIPAAYPFVITVSATDRNAQKSFYSNFGKIDIAAPGGAGDGVNADQYGYGPDDILSTRDGGYFYEAGTSMACPHVVGVCALLMSVAGVTAQKVFDPNNRATSVLTKNANSSKTGQTQVPDPNYGYGLLDAYKALLQVYVSAVIVKPEGINPTTGQSTDPAGLPPPPIETLRPAFAFQLNNIPIGNVNIVLQEPNGNNIAIITNGVANASLVAQNILYSDVPSEAAANPPLPFHVTGDSSGQNGPYTISFRYRFDTTLPSVQQTIMISGQPADTTQPASTDTRSFTLAPHSFSSGITMISIPVYEDTIDSPSKTLRDAKAILNAPDAVLYRWVNTPQLNPQGQPAVQGQYAINGSGTGDTLPTEASLHPSDIPTTFPTLIPPTPGDPDPPNKSPLGLGYFLKVTSGVQVKTYGVEYTDQLVRVPLHEGWNIVGDPFSIAVPFATTQIELPDGSRIPAQQAVDSKLILPFIYSYINGDYQLNQLPGGNLEPWEGHWIYVVPKNPNNLNQNSTLNLIVPPSGSQVTSSRAAVTSRAVAHGPYLVGPGSWSLQLGVRSGDQVDSHNYIGMSANASDADDQTKAPKPPRLNSTVSLGLKRSGTTLYAQDLRALGHTETWNLVVSTDQPNTDVTMIWPGMSRVPRNYHLTLADTATGETYNMRNQSSYQFHFDTKNLTRSLVITASPSDGQGRAMISGLFVDPSLSQRSTGQGAYEIRYSLSRAAQVDISVLGLNGRVVGQIQPSRDVSAGPNRIAWDGRAVTGRALPAGTYRLQVRAVTPEGDVTREVYALTITR